MVTLRLKIKHGNIYHSASLASTSLPNMQFWPILGLLVSHPMKEPVIIGLYCGAKKPSSAVEFMQKFVQELQNLENGFVFKGKNITLKLHTVICHSHIMVIRAVICDHILKFQDSYMFNVCTFLPKSIPCLCKHSWWIKSLLILIILILKCAQRGQHINRKMSYPLTEYRLRTNESFAQRIDEFALQQVLRRLSEQENTIRRLTPNNLHLVI